MACILRRVRRRQLAAVAGIMIAIVLTSTHVAHAGGGPVLGWAHAFPNGKGFGLVRPRHVYLGGDPTGGVTGLRWPTWGAARTSGFGTGWCPGRTVADGYYCSVSLHAYDLGRCHGRRGYRALAFYFNPGPHRRWAFGSKWNVCSGQALA